MHIHACEQPGEIDESMEEYDKPPLAALESMGLLDDRVTIIHGTHLSEGELEILADRQPTICACPTTERNLGDGFLPATELMDRGVPICLGTDSHANIDPWEEMRLVEYHERLQKQRRNVLASYADPRAVATDPDGSDRLSTAEVCWEMGTRHGARALGLPGGELKPGRLADFTALDLDHISLEGADAESLLPSIVFSMTPGAVSDVFVGGEPVVRGGQLTSS
jgi:formimidoylglutamate deiminase